MGLFSNIESWLKILVSFSFFSSLFEKSNKDLVFSFLLLLSSLLSLSLSLSLLIISPNKDLLLLSIILAKIEFSLLFSFIVSLSLSLLNNVAKGFFTGSCLMSSFVSFLLLLSVTLFFSLFNMVKSNLGLSILISIIFLFFDSFFIVVFLIFSVKGILMVFSIILISSFFSSFCSAMLFICLFSFFSSSCSAFSSSFIPAIFSNSYVFI